MGQIYGNKIKQMFLILAALAFMHLHVFAGCPSMNCPADSATPIVEYLFENTLIDSSGHNLDAGPATNASCFPSFYNNIGGRPGYYVDNFMSGAACGISFPACTLSGAEGEIEWYEYVTLTAANTANVALYWSASNSNNGNIVMFCGGASSNNPDMFQLNYSYLDSGITVNESLDTQCLAYNQWQHISIQWGSFGLRLLVDGIERTGSVNQWYKITDSAPAYIGSGPDQYIDDMFLGYIDDFKIWPCAPVLTPTFTLTPSVTNTPTITPTFTVSGTQTCTPDYTMTGTPTISPTPSVTFTVSPVLTPSGVTLVGVFPNPAGKITRLIFTSDSACRAGVSIYTVSGEKVNTLSYDAGAGMNGVDIPSKNSRGSALASGVYIYSIELLYADNRKNVFWGQYTIIR